jgi:hypothetical protein
MFEDLGLDEGNGADDQADEEGEDSDAPLHFNLSDPDQIR